MCQQRKTRSSDSIDQALGLEKGTYSAVATPFNKEDGKPIFLGQQKLNVLLNDLLVYFARVVGDEKTAERLTAVRSGEGWCRTWLNTEGWVSHQFFRAWLVGQRAFVHEENELAGEPRAFERDFEDLLKTYLNGRETAQDCVGPSLERLVAHYEEASGGHVEADARVPDVGVMFQTLWTYAKDMGRDDLRGRIRELASRVANGESGCSSKVRSTAARFLSLVDHFDREDLFAGWFGRLARLQGCYETHVGGVHRTVTPTGFERNLMLLARTDCLARGRARSRLEKARPGNEPGERLRNKLLCFGECGICSGVREFMGEDESIPTSIGRIAGWELLDKLLFKILLGVAKGVNFTCRGRRPACHIENRPLKGMGRISPAELDSVLACAAVEALCYLKGWQRWSGPDDGDETERILGDVGGAPGGGGEMDIPILRYLYGGDTGENLFDYFDSLLDAILDSKIDGSEEPPIVIPIGGGCGDVEDGECHKMLEDFPDPTDWEQDVMLRVDGDVVPRLMAVFRKFDPRFADYVWLVSFGFNGFEPKGDYPLLKTFRERLRGKDRLTAKDARTLLEIGANTTHWHENEARRLVGELRRGEYNEELDEEEIAMLIRVLTRKDKEAER